MDRILCFSVFITFSLFLVPSLGQPKKDAGCPKCFHVEYRTRNLPILAKTIIDMLLSKLNLSNPNCMNNKVVPETCKKSVNPFRMETKCTTIKADLKAIGFKSIFPDAELYVNVLVRSCKTVAYGTKDKCQDLSEIGFDKAELMKRIRHLETQWNSITYNGYFCTESP